MRIHIPQIDETDSVQPADKRESQLVIDDQHGVATERDAAWRHRTDRVLLETPNRRAAASEEALAEWDLLAAKSFRQPDPDARCVDQARTQRLICKELDFRLLQREIPEVLSK